MTDGERPLPIGERRELLIGTAPAKDRRGRRAVGPGRRGPELRTHGQPDGGTLGGDPFGQHTNEARQHVVGGVGLARSLGEPREHLVRGRALAVHHTVGQPSRALSHRLERHGHHRGRHRRQEGAPIVTDQRADADDEPDVHDRDERRQHREHHGPADHDVDVVQPVLQHRDRDRRVQEEEREGREHLGAREDAVGHHERRRDERSRGNEPLELEPLLAARTTEPHHEAREGQREAHQDQDEAHTEDDVRDRADRIGNVASLRSQRRAPDERGQDHPPHGEDGDHDDVEPCHPSPPFRRQVTVGEQQEQQRQDPDRDRP